MAMASTGVYELTPDQLEIGKEYRVERYGISETGIRDTYLYGCIARYEKNRGIFMIFRITNPGDYVENPMAAANYPVGQLEIPMSTNSRHNFYWKFFLTARDIVPKFEQKALRDVFHDKIKLDEATAWGLTNRFLATNPKPVKKSGGRKYKTRQTKPRRKNRTRRQHPKSRRRNSIASGRRRITRAN